MRVAVAWALVTAIGCSGWIEQRAATTTYRVLVQANTAARRQADVELARAAAPAGVIQLETFALAYPSHREFRALWRDALCDYATGFVFDEWEDAELGGRAKDAARIAERLRGLLATCVAANLAELPAGWRSGPGSRDDVSAMLWVATAEASELALDPLRTIGRLPETIRLLERCAALAPGFRDGAAELLIATLTSAVAGLPVIASPDRDGKAAFARARTAGGAGNLMVDVLAARMLERGDRERQRTALTAILAVDLTRWPERRLVNELARRKAERYLASLAVTNDAAATNLEREERAR